MTRNSLPATIYVLAIGGAGIGALLALTDRHALTANGLPLAVFAVLSFALKRAGFHAVPQVTHSLVGIIDLAAVLTFGPVLGAWVGAISSFWYLFLNSLRRERITSWDSIGIPVFSAGLKIGMAFASSRLYLALGGMFAPQHLSLALVGPALAAMLTWFVIDHVGWGLLEFLQGGVQAVVELMRRILLYSLLMELLPLPFAVVITVAFSSDEMGVFVMMALGLVATAIVVQRFADTSAMLERRRNELAVLNEFGQALAQATFDADKAVDLLYEHVQRILPANLTRIEFANPEHTPNSTLVLEATEATTQHPNQAQADSAVIEYFTLHRDPIRALDLAKNFVFPLETTEIALRLRDTVQLSKRAPRSLLIVPLFAGDDLIGALSLFSAHPRAFSAHQERNVISMCAQTAVTIQNARLYAVERKRATQLATISEVSRHVASYLDIDELLQNVVTRVRERFGYANVHIYTVDSDARYAVFRASSHPRSAEWRERGVRLRIGLEGIIGWVAATGEPLNVDDVSKDSRFIRGPDHTMEIVGSEIAVPLVIGNQVRGVLDVSSTQVGAFSEDDLFVLKTLAAQVAVALEDARLYNSQREEAYYLNVLLQVAENLSATSTLDEVLETVVRITPLLVGVARCAVLLYDPKDKVFTPVKFYGLAREMQNDFNQIRFPADNESAFGRLVRVQTPLVIEDAKASDLLEIKYLQTFGIRSLLMAPLVTRGEVVGAMLVDQGTRPTRFSQHEIEVVMGIANQAAVAIEGVRLTREAEQKKRMDYELGLARQIQQSFLPDACPVLPGYEICAMWQTAREVSGDFYDFVSLSDGRQAIVIADVSDKGMAAAMFMALSRTILRAMTIGKHSSREAVERANDIILADSRSEMFVTVFHSTLDLNTHRLSYVNAGHNPPFYYCAARRELTTLKGHGLALGVMPNITFEEYAIDLAQGDVVLMYTDGVTDAINSQEEEFGADRLADLVAANVHLCASDLIDEITRAVTAFAGEGVHFDDVTMVALKRVQE